MVHAGIKFGLSQFGGDLPPEDQAIFDDWLDQIGIYYKPNLN